MNMCIYIYNTLIEYKLLHQKKIDLQLRSCLFGQKFSYPTLLESARHKVSALANIAVSASNMNAACPRSEADRESLEDW